MTLGAIPIKKSRIDKKRQKGREYYRVSIPPCFRRSTILADADAVEFCKTGTDDEILLKLLHTDD